MNYSRVGAGTVLIVLLIMLMTGITYLFSSGLSTSILPMLLLFVLDGLVVRHILRWVVDPSSDQMMRSQRKVDRALRDLDDNDLNLLRSRLAAADQADNYDSMTELVQSGKRKNEVR
jgi:ABC-type transport system involved in cytochrome bd biosynthesis fused ATPase/permease subunit